MPRSGRYGVRRCASSRSASRRGGADRLRRSFAASAPTGGHAARATQMGPLLAQRRQQGYPQQSRNTAGGETTCRCRGAFCDLAGMPPGRSTPPSSASSGPGCGFGRGPLSAGPASTASGRRPRRGPRRPPRYLRFFKMAQIIPWMSRS